MAVIGDILRTKGSHVRTVGPDASVLDAARLMNEHKIGSVVVAEEGRLVGIFTERDILRRIVAEARDPADTKVRQVMTTQVACCRSETTIAEARSVMKNRRIRHLPVIDEEWRLLGMVSIGDLNAHDATDKEVTIQFLHEYLYGQT